MEEDFLEILTELNLDLKVQNEVKKETDAQIHYSRSIERESLAKKIKTKAKSRKATEITNNNRTYAGHWVSKQDDTGWWIV